MKKQLILEDGSVFVGTAFGSERECIGEVVFHTSITGYQEIISDPTNHGKIVLMTYPLIGNYGINRDDFETIHPTIKGLIVKEAAEFPSNWRSDMTLDHFLQQKGIPGLAGIDTRKLMRMIRSKGILKGAFCNVDEKTDDIVARLKATTLPKDQVKQVSTQKHFPSPGRGYSIVVVDFGLKHGILRELNQRQCDVTVLPYDTSAQDILALKPDGVLLSNGPGNPLHATETIEMIQTILGKIPLFGIGLGHQLFALANGAEIEKMLFGHHGSSYPVKNVHTNKVIFTAQNNLYTVKEDDALSTSLKITYRNLNDHTIAGLVHKIHPAFSVQFHPEASPGAEDAKYLFDEFLQMIEVRKREESNHA